jgi:hypothetical protein
MTNSRGLGDGSAAFASDDTSNSDQSVARFRFRFFSGLEDSVISL